MMRRGHDAIVDSGDDDAKTEKWTVLVAIGELSTALGLSTSRVRQLADQGIFDFVRTAGGHRRFNLEHGRLAWAAHQRDRSGPTQIRRDSHSPQLRFEASVVPVGRPDWSSSYPLIDLAEDFVFAEMVAALKIDRHRPAWHIMAYAFNEMVNNAIDHSGGMRVEVAAWVDEHRWAFSVLDDGEGIFPQLRRGLGLAHDFEALLELTKGKQTTMPERHSGEGVFFTSKMVDVFRLSSAGIRYTVDNDRDDFAVGNARTRLGTLVEVSIDADTSRTSAQVFAQFSDVDHGFFRTRPAVALAGLGLTFASRSEARRLLSGLDDFTEIDADFAGVTDVGQGFVDELIRVWPSMNPGKTVNPINMVGAVEMMVLRILPKPR